MLFRGGLVFDGKKLVRADVLVQDGYIQQVGKVTPPEGEPVFNAENCLLSPGFCDLHVHLREPGFTEKETMATGTKAAAAGGFTTICSMPNLSPVPDSAQTLAVQLAAIEKDALVQVIPFGAITKGQKGIQLADYAAMAPLVAGFSDDGLGVQQQGVLRKAMEQIACLNRFVATHCEDESLILEGSTCVQQDSDFALQNAFTGVSNQSEWAQVQRDIQLCEETGCPLHICHISTAQSIALVQKAKEKGLPVTCEVTPHNLLLTCDDITENNGRFKMNPPLRTAQDAKAAREGLANGVIDAVATDHAPHTKQQKDGGFSTSFNGVVGLETAFPSLYTGLVQTGQLPLEKLLYSLTVAPRKILGLTPLWIQPGEKADFVVLGLDIQSQVQPSTFASKGRATPFENLMFSGWPLFTYCQGTLVWKREM